jgi:hypothetical protein
LPSISSSTDSEHEPLDALSVRWVWWSKALEVGVDDARRSSAEESSKTTWALSVVFPLWDSGLVGLCGKLSLLNVQVESMACKLIVFEVLQAEPGTMNQ